MGTLLGVTLWVPSSAKIWVATIGTPIEHPYAYHQTIPTLIQADPIIEHNEI